MALSEQLMFASTALVILAALTGCSSGAAATTDTSRSPTPSAIRSRSPSASPTPPRGTAAAPACKPRQVTAPPLQPGGGAAGTFFVEVLITTETTDCRLKPRQLVLRGALGTLARLQITLNNGSHALQLPVGRTALVLISTPDEPSACRAPRIDNPPEKQKLRVTFGSKVLTEGVEPKGICIHDWKLNTAGDPFYIPPRHH